MNRREYQDSDDDIYWGPVTLKEKKRDVLRKVSVKYIKGRSSVSADPTFIDDKPSRLTELVACDLQNPINSDSTSQESEDFITKVAEVLDLTVPTEEGSYFTAKENPTISDNEFKEEISTMYHSISSSNSSLVDDIVNISSEKESSISTDDSSADLDIKQEGTYEIPKFTIQNTVKDLIECFNNLDVIEEVDENTQFDTNPPIQITSPEEFEIEESINEVSNVENSSSNDTSFKFNDTLEEMERFMMYGQNYRMSCDNIVNTRVSDKSESKSEDEVLTQRSQFNKPTGIPILSRSVTKTPVQKKIINQNDCIRLTKSAGKDRFKDIQSPVALYIKNSGRTPLFKTVTPGKVDKENIPEAPLTFKVKSDFDTAAFPAVRYKPGKMQKVIEEEFKLPPSINTLIPLKAKVGVHQRRIGRHLDKSIIDGDLTIADSSLNSSKDISVVEKKNIFM